METVVEFRSTKFPPCDGEEGVINPGLWGKRLAEYLIRGLTERGIVCDEIVPEDWGWYIPIQNDGFRLALCCGHQDGDDDQFLCFTEPQKPVLKKLFRTIDATSQLARLTAAVRDTLASDPDIRDVIWTAPR